MAPDEGNKKSTNQHVIELLKVENQSNVIRQTDGPSDDSASPNALQEIKSNMEQVFLSAKELAGNDQAQINAIDKLYKLKLDELASYGAGCKANLFEEENSAENKAFLKQLKKVTPILADFTRTAAKISNVKVKDLDAQGHKRRSKDSKATIVHEFTTPEQEKANKGDSHFIIYEPAGRLTKHQIKMQKLQGEEQPNVNHATTSHHKKGLVEGNSNFMRMITGTKHQDGTVTITNDSFSGPGARMPYKDLNKRQGPTKLFQVDKYKNMAVKAITFSNQEEIVQGLAQRIYEKNLAGKSKEDINKLLKGEGVTQGKMSDIEYKQALISQYFTENPLTETYTQVISPDQGRIPIPDSDANTEQFEYVKDAIRAFDGASNLSLTIDTDDGTPLEVNSSYKGQHGCFGVNGFQIHTGSMARNQNARFMNQLMDDTINSLPESLEGIESYAELKSALGKPSGITEAEELTDLKELYREAMQAYDEAYQTYNVANNKYKANGGEGPKPSKDDFKAKYKVIEALESSVKNLEAKVDEQQRDLETTRATKFESGVSKQALSNFKTAISHKIMVLKANAEPNQDNAAEIKKLQGVYNRCAYLVEAQGLYYNGSWAKTENTFKLQTLTASLATELDHGNTKGCKSNNDRGQRLAQKIAGNALATSNTADGLYDGQYLNNPSNEQAKNLNKPLTFIQMINHRLNTGVGGGKFGLKKVFGFADNGLQGKVAKQAKLDDVTNTNLKITLPLIAVIICTGGLALPVIMAVNKSTESSHNKEATEQANSFVTEAEVAQEQAAAAAAETAEVKQGQTAAVTAMPPDYQSISQFLEEGRNSPTSVIGGSQEPSIKSGRAINEVQIQEMSDAKAQAEAIKQENASVDQENSEGLVVSSAAKLEQEQEQEQDIEQSRSARIN